VFYAERGHWERTAGHGNAHASMVPQTPSTCYADLLDSSNEGTLVPYFAMVTAWFCRVSYGLAMLRQRLVGFVHRRHHGALFCHGEGMVRPCFVWFGNAVPQTCWIRPTRGYLGALFCHGEGMVVPCFLRFGNALLGYIWRCTVLSLRALWPFRRPPSQAYT
jgi:hypothetical protein